MFPNTHFLDFELLTVTYLSNWNWVFSTLTLDTGLQSLFIGCVCLCKSHLGLCPIVLLFLLITHRISIQAVLLGSFCLLGCRISTEFATVIKQITKIPWKQNVIMESYREDFITPPSNWQYFSCCTAALLNHPLIRHALPEKVFSSTQMKICVLLPLLALKFELHTLNRAQLYHCEAKTIDNTPRLLPKLSYLMFTRHNH